MPFIDIPQVDPNQLPSLWAPPPLTQSISSRVNSVTIGYTVQVKIPDGNTYHYRNTDEILHSLIYAYENISRWSLSKEERALLEKVWIQYTSSRWTTLSLTDILRFLSTSEDARMNEISNVIGNSISTDPQNLYLLLSESLSREAGRFRWFLTDLIGKIPPKELSNLILIIGWLDRTQDISGIMASLTPEQRAEITEIMKDPRSRRVFLQDVVLRMTHLIYRETGVRIDAISFGWREHGDGGMIISIPGKAGKPIFLIITKHHTTVAETATEALDTLSMANKSPVFTHYLIDASGKILWQIETPLSVWTRDQIFPTAELMERWTRNPSLIPTGVSLDISLFNHRNKVTLTQKTKNGWFAQLGISEGNIWGIRANTSFANFGWQYKSQENTLTLHTSASSTNFDPRGFRDVEGLSFGANWYNSLGKVGSITLSSSGSAYISAQATEWNWRNPQIGEWVIKNSVHANSQISPHTTISTSIGSKYNWAPWNVTPNTFDHIQISDRDLWRALSSTEYGFQVAHILQNGEKIDGNIHYEIWPLAKKIQGQVSYTLADGKTRLIGHWEKTSWTYNSNTYYGFRLEHKF